MAEKVQGADHAISETTDTTSVGHLVAPYQDLDAEVYCRGCGPD